VEDKRGQSIRALVIEMPLCPELIPWLEKIGQPDDKHRTTRDANLHSHEKSKEDIQLMIFEIEPRGRTPANRIQRQATSMVTSS
jgi:hypothetical protein